jgi:hydroxyacylglutathione hydrolase
MPVTILPFNLGPLENNTYLLVDQSSGQVVVVDPAFGVETAIEEIHRHGWSLAGIWITHAHFDHIAGVTTLRSAFPSPVSLALHPADHPLWKAGGGSQWFGLPMPPLPDPDQWLEHGQLLTLGETRWEVRHTPGHSAGHVIFYAPDLAVALCGDLIFRRGVGRTDLPGANSARLVQSIRQHVFSLPPHTRLLCGHGPETTVQEEIEENPFVSP